MLTFLNKAVSLDDIIDLITKKLDEGGNVTFTPKGGSMLPTLRDGKDSVVLAKPQGRLKRFDVPLYKRKNGEYVLHRIVKLNSDGSYVMCGDNQLVYEYGITDGQIIGVMTSFCRNGKIYTTQSKGYKLYVRLRHYTRFFRRCYFYVVRKLNKHRK